MTEWPITFADAAGRLHCSVRWLRDHLKKHPCGRRSGRSIIFTEADFAALLASLQPSYGPPPAPLTPEPSERQIARALRRHLGKRTGRRGPRNYMKPPKPAP